jgi:hypothetical protein
VTAKLGTLFGTFYGIDAWIPSSDVGERLCWGVDRSIEPERFIDRRCSTGQPACFRPAPIGCEQ